MAVQIPQIRRTEPVDPSSVGRVTANVPEGGAEVYGKITSDITKIGKQAFDYLNEEDKNFANTEKTKVTQDYETWYRTQIEGSYDSATKQRKPGLKHLDGDPTEAYLNFDNSAKEKMNELLGGNKNYSERVRAAVQQGLESTHSSLYQQRLAIEGQQYDTYDQVTTDGRVALDKLGTVESLQFFDINKPTSTLRPFEDKLDSIEDTILQRSIRVGSAAKDEAGEYAVKEGDTFVRVKANPSVKVTIAKHQSEAVYEAINNLFAAGRLDQAEYMMTRYKEFIDPVQDAKLTEQHEKLKVEKEAYSAFEKYGDSTTKEIEEGIKKLSPKAKSMAYELIDARDRRIEELDKRRSTDAYDAIMIEVEQRKLSGNDILSTGALKQDPIYKARIKDVTNEKQYKAIHAITEKPKESDPSVRDSVSDLMSSGGFEGMSASELRTHLAGLNEKHTEYFLRQREKINSTTDSGERAGANYMFKEGYNQWLSSKELYKEVRGFETSKSKQARMDFQNHVRELYRPGMSNKEMEAIVKREKNRIIQEKLKNKGSSWWDFDTNVFNWFGASKDKPKASEEGVPVDTKIEAKDLQGSMQAFKKTNGRLPNDYKELDEWVKKGGK